jgi:hypothetical protein
MALRDASDEDDELRYEFEELQALLEVELRRKVPSPPALLAPGVAAMTQTTAPPLSPPPSPDFRDERFLDADEYDYILQIATGLIDTQTGAARKRLLMECGFRDKIVSSIDVEGGSSNVAATIVSIAEEWDKFNSAHKYLENLIFAIIKGTFEGNEVETRLKEIIAHYNHKRNSYRKRAPSPGYDKRLTPEERETSKQLDAALGQYGTHSQISPHTIEISSYKIDTNDIIKLNLHDERRDFIKSFNENYRGFFTFSVTSFYYDVLENYILASLQWELKQRTYRPILFRPITIYLDSLDVNIEQGNISLQQQIRQFLSGKSLRDVLEDRQDAHLVVVLRNGSPPSPAHKEIAALFSETVKQQVSDIVQNRCLILFWANYGAASIQPLEISVTFPAFERFQTEQVIGWLDSLSYKLKIQNIPEQDITYWRERMVEKIRYHDGRLPDAYTCLVESLEPGGAF